MKYIVNNNLEAQICELLKTNVDAQIFWLSYFKPQLSCSADEFCEAIRQVAEINNIQPGWYASKYAEFEKLMVDCEYVVSAESHAEMICKIVEELVAATSAKPGVNTLRHQFKLYKGEF